MEWQYGSNNVNPTKATLDLPYSNNVNLSPPQNLLFDYQKKFNFVGYDPQYIITIQLGSSITAFSKFYVQFGKGVAPLLNSREGSVTCKIRNVWAHCVIIGSRLLEIYSNTDITVAVGTQVAVEITIDGVTQSTLNDNKLRVGLSINGNVQTINNRNYRDLDFQAEVSKAVVSNEVGAANFFTAISADLDGESYRAPTTHTIRIQLPTGKVSGSEIFIDFFSLQNSFLRTPICKIYNTVTNPQTDLANGQCQFISKQRLQIPIKPEMKTQNDAGLQKYSLVLSYLGYPNSPNLEQFPSATELKYLFLQYRIFFANANDIISSSELYSGQARNIYPQNPSNLIDLKWSLQKDSFNDLQNNFEIGIGFFNSDFYLLPENLASYKTSMLISVETINNQAQQIDISPTQLRAYINDQFLAVKIGTKSTANAGPLVISFLKNYGNSYAKVVPDLYVNINKKKCQVLVAAQAYKIAKDSFSWPIELNFSQCLPIGDMFVQASVTGVTAQVENQNQKISFSQNSDNNYIISFRVKSSQLGVAKMNFQITGVNQDQYSPITAVDLEFLDPAQMQTAMPDMTVRIQNFVLNSQFRVEAFLDCNIPDVDIFKYRVYYAYHIKNDCAAGCAEKPTIKSIKDSIAMRGRGLQSKNDPFWNYFSYQEQGNVGITINSLPDLKQSSEYVFYAFCENQLGTASKLFESKFSTSQTQEFLLNVEVILDGQLDIPKQRSLGCALANVLSIHRLQVSTNQFVQCDDYEASSSGKIVQSQATKRRRELFYIKMPPKIDSYVGNNYYSLQNSEVQYQKGNEFKQCDLHFVHYSSCYAQELQKEDSQRRMLQQQQQVDKIQQYSYNFYLIPTDQLSANFDSKLLLNQLYDPNINTFVKNNLSQTLPNIQMLRITQTNSNTIPTISTLESYVNYERMELYLKLNSNGYVYMGLDYRQNATPSNHTQILKGLNGDNLPFEFYKRKQMKKNIVEVITADHLSDDVDYKLYMIISSDEPTPAADFDPVVYTINFKIQKKWDIPDIHDHRLNYSVSILILSLIIMMFLNL